MLENALHFFGLITVSTSHKFGIVFMIYLSWSMYALVDIIDLRFLTVNHCGMLLTIACLTTWCSYALESQSWSLLFKITGLLAIGQLNLTQIGVCWLLNCMKALLACYGRPLFNSRYHIHSLRKWRIHLIQHLHRKYRMHSLKF